MLITTGGDVGIGLVTPQAKQHVLGKTLTDVGTGAGTTTFVQAAANVFNQLTGGAPATTGATDPNINLRLMSYGTATTDIGMDPSGNTWIQARNAADMTANYSLLLNPNGGNVGIGTAAPQSLLSVHSGAPRISIVDTDAAISSVNPAWIIRSKDEGVANGAFLIQSTTDYTAFSDRLAIRADGHVGIGTTAPDAKAEIVSTSSGATTEVLKLTNESIAIDTAVRLGFVPTTNDITLAALTAIRTNLSGVGGATDLAFNTYGADAQVDGGGERMRIMSTGNVGIGKADPGSKLDVKGTLRLSGSTSGYVGLAPAAVAGATTYTLPAADGTNGQVLSTSGSGTLSWASPSGGSTANYQSFTTAGTFTWNKPSGINMCFVEAVGGGGGGSSGVRGATGTNRVGGSGGGAGQYAFRWLPASALGSTASVVVGAGGNGGAAVTTDTTGGNSGFSGAETTFGTFLRAQRGDAGGNPQTSGTIGGIGSSATGFGSAASETGFLSPNSMGVRAGPWGSTGTGGGTTSCSSSTQVVSLSGPGGGGGGLGYNTGNVAGTNTCPGAVGFANFDTSVAVVQPGGSNGRTNPYMTGNTAGNYGDGGDGGVPSSPNGENGYAPGGGGGGGAGMTNGTNSGAGGAGGAGRVDVWCW